VLIDLVDGLSSGSVVLVNAMNGNLANHDARCEGEAAERQAMTIMRRPRCLSFFLSASTAAT
jgi:hypothetical protein